MNLQDRLGKVPSETLEVGYFDGVKAAQEWLGR